MKQQFVGRVCRAFIAVLWLAAAGCHGANSAPAAPIVLTEPDLKMAPGSASAIALGPDAKRVYVGRQYSYDQKRLNLIVATLDDNGKVVGEPRRYRDTMLPLPPAQVHATVSSILVDSPHRKLYLTYTMTGAKVPDVTKLLSVYDLDENGEPVGEPRTYESGNPNKSLQTLARHPQLNVLYMSGWGLAAVMAYRLDEKGEPQGEPKVFNIGGQGKFEIAISPDGKHMYLGTYRDTVEVVDLDETGMPTGKPRTYVAGKEEVYLRFAYTPKALYVRRTTPEGVRLAYWPLDAAGNPVGEPSLTALPSSAMALDAAHSRLWYAADDTFKDAFTGKTIVQGVAPASLAINADGSLNPQPQVYPGALRQAGVAMASAANGTPLLISKAMPYGVLGNRVRDYRVRLTLLEVATPNAPPAKFDVDFGSPPQRVSNLELNKPSDWINVDKWLKDQMGAPLLNFTTYPWDMQRLKVRIEVAQGDPAAGGKLLANLTDEVLGNNLQFFLPGYGYEPPAQREAAIELLSAHAQKYLAAAQAVAVAPDDRPRQFMVSCYQMMGGQGHVEQLKTETSTVSDLGFNTVNAYSWGNIPPKQLDELLDAGGLQRRSLAVYNPPSYFDFDQDKMNPAALAKWADEFKKQLAPNGGAPSDVADFKLADEPGWYYPTMLDEVRNNPVRLKAFRDYLAQQGMQPAHAGKASWDEVFPIGASQAVDLPSRRLFYWTMRFFPEAAARGHLLARKALEKVFPNARFIDVNYNNWLSAWYTASPNKKVANNPIANPDSGMGAFDWLHAGRLGSNTPWTEDWFGDASSQTWSLYGDLLRSCAMLGQGQPYGSYVIGGTIGGHKAGGRLRMLSLIGHGAKALDVYTWGPEVLFPGNCWSESFGAYGPIADGLRMVGRGERLLFPGQPERGKVAIMMPGGSGLWEKDLISPHYHQELWPLHFALMHAGYTVDFVDDADVANGELTKRGYSVLYVTAPNVWSAAQKQIAAWVNAGGTLVALPGAATADEYNTPSTVLDPVLQLHNRSAVRDAAPAPDSELPTTGTLTFKDARFGTGQMAVRGPVAPLATQGAVALAQWEDQTAALTASRYGKGRAIAYGFYPGWQYWLSPNRSVAGRLPLHWGEAQRRLVVQPAVLANTPKNVTVSQEGVEACRLQSEQGIAIVLLNWTDEPITSVTVQVPRTGKFHKVTSLDNGDVTATAAGDSLKITLPLKNADVLMIE